jgi:hypothetical protein
LTVIYPLPIKKSKLLAKLASSIDQGPHHLPLKISIILRNLFVILRTFSPHQKRTTENSIEVFVVYAPFPASRASWCPAKYKFDFSEYLSRKIQNITYSTLALKFARKQQKKFPFYRCINWPKWLFIGVNRGNPVIGITPLILQCQPIFTNLPARRKELY